MKKIGKQLIVLLFAVSLIFVLLCGCDTAPVESSAGPSSTVENTPTKAPTQKPTVKPTEVPSPTPEPTPADPAANKLVYTIEFDAHVTNENFGFLLAGFDEQNYIMAQFSIGEYDDGFLYYRPHQWIDNNWELLDEVAVDNEVVAPQYSTLFHVKIEMNNHTMTTFINGTEVGSDEVEDGTYGMIGFRTAKTTEEEGMIDNLVIKNAVGDVVLSEDFEGETTFFDEAIADWDIQVEYGSLVVGQKVDILLIDPPALVVEGETTT